MGYDHKVVEAKWQLYWRANKTFKTLGPGDQNFDPDKPKYYVLDMFPYPSGAGLHVGHPEGYTATDIVARYKRMCGFNVLHPMGWDAFGLPAEEYARSTNQHPEDAVRANVATFRRQIEALGFSYDWDREFSTTDPDYYRWTQWIFLQLWNAWFDPHLARARPISELPIPPEFDHDDDARQAFRNSMRLAYVAEVPVWWCERLGTVMANEEVKDGRTVDKGYDCVRLPLRQWMFRITAFADRLVEGLERLDWPEGIKKQQRDWIGRSTGAEIDFPVNSPASGALIRVFTTRPDTLFGATYLMLAPEHPLVAQVTRDDRRSTVDAYLSAAASKSEIDRATGSARDKTGVFTGAFAQNPANGESIPIWIADYVLASYGTGAVMAVPAHDQRDFEFARKFDLPIRAVVLSASPPTPDTADGAFEGEGTAVHSPWIEGQSTANAKLSVVQRLEALGLGRRAVTYRLRDWLFSRQRYWGEPIPVLHNENGETTAVPDAELPVLLPKLENYQPQPGVREPLLARAKNWCKVTDPMTGKTAQREMDTMPGWAGSCWYYLRFTDARNNGAPWSLEREQYWMPVDLYIGGAEHAVLHLLYSRFWHQALFDLGHVSTPEPFQKLFNQGLILSFVATDKGGVKVPMDQVVQVKFHDKDGQDGWAHRDTQEPLSLQVGKMSKSMKNVVNPDDVVAKYGADTLRLYEMFMGPLDVPKPWNMRDVEGPFGFLQRVFRLAFDKDGELRESLREDLSDDPVMERLLHLTIREVTNDINSLRFNTAIARMMEFVNGATKAGTTLSRSQMKRFVLLLAPFAPHLAEELWQALGEMSSLAYAPWPSYAGSLLIPESLLYAVQVNGKMRARVEVPADTGREHVEEVARAAVARWIDGKDVKTFRPKDDNARIVSFVTRDSNEATR